MPIHDYVFGFGSLVRLEDVARFLDQPSGASGEVVICGLRDHRRVWNVARDNMQNIPDRPHFVCAETGVRLKIFVTFLNIRPQNGDTINGVALRVNEGELAQLDRREALYERIDVTDQIDDAPDGRVWVYRGTEEARICFQKGVDLGRAFINTSYLEGVVAGFAELGTGHLASFYASSDAPNVPLRPIVRTKG